MFTDFRSAISNNVLIGLLATSLHILETVTFSKSSKIDAHEYDETTVMKPHDPTKCFRGGAKIKVHF